MSKAGHVNRPWQANTLAWFEASSARVFTLQELSSLIDRLSAELELPASTRPHRVIRFLLDTGRLRKTVILPENVSPEEHAKRELYGSGQTEVAELTSRRGYKTFPRYIWEEASAYEVALSLRKGSYLSHASAVYLHALTPQIPRIVYVNKEQSPKPEPTGSLTQQGIDRAFANTPRTSNYVFVFEGTRIVLLSGKNTGNLEVSDVVGPTGQAFRATKLERTLIDITVRPNYAGGVFDVFRAFSAAVDRGVSIPTIIATLRRLNHVYPYHQSLGFYLQHVGAPMKSLQRLQELGLEYDFYLAHRMPEKQYDPTWRIYYPAGLIGAV